MKKKRNGIRLFLAITFILIFSRANVHAEIIYGDNDGITRAEWMHDLVEVFSIEVDEADFPDNYYPDLTDKTAYYNDIMKAVAYGLVDVEAGSDFEPDSKMTRDFAADTLNQYLKYQLEKDEAYSFSDVGDCHHPDSDQIAVKLGWFQLENDNFKPEAIVSSDEAETILTNCIDILQSEEVSETHANVFDFADDVIVVPEGTEVSSNENNTITIISCPVNINVGDKFGVYINGIASVYEAKKISVSDNTTTIETTIENIGDGFDKIDAEGIISSSDYVIIPEEGVTVDVEEEEVPSVSGSYLKGSNKSRAVKKLKNIKAIKSFDVSGVKLTLTFTLKKSHVEYKTDHNQIMAKLVGDASMKVEGSANVASMLLDKTSVPLYTAEIPGIGGVNVSAYITADVKTSITSNYHLNIGFDIRKDSGMRLIQDTQATSYHARTEVTGSAGVRMKLGIYNLRCLSAYIDGDAGIKAILSSDDYVDGKLPLNCIDFFSYIYASSGAHCNVSIYGWNKSLYDKETIYFDANTSPIKIHKHYEDGRPVLPCTRGNKYNYYTNGSSPYWGSGWISGDDAYGLDGEGNPALLYEYTLSTDENTGEQLATITKYKGNASYVNIPEEIDGYKVVSIGEYSFLSHKELIGVDIPDSVHTIRPCAFTSCTALESVKLSNNLTTLYGRSFERCTSLRSIRIPKSLTGSTAEYDVGDYRYKGPFAYCDNLDDVEIEEGIKTIPNNLFCACTGKLRMTIPNTVTKIEGSAFSGCTSMESIIIPDSVTEIHAGAFVSCTSLESVKLSNNLTTLYGRSFERCTSLRSIRIPKSLTGSTAEYDVGDYRWKGPFAYCDNLDDVEIEDGIKTIPNNLFCACTGRLRMTIPNTVTKIEGSAFSGCTSMESIIIPDSVTEIHACAFAGCTALESVKLSNNLTTLYGRSFERCTSLKTIKIPKSLTGSTAEYDVGDYRYKGPFAYCENLDNVEIEDGTKTIFDSFFLYCTGKLQMTIPDTVTKIGGNAFAECTSLENIKIPNSVVEIGSGIFSGCSKLESITMSNNITSIPGESFKNCSSLKSFTIPDGVTGLGSSLFAGCRSLTDVKLNKECTAITSHMFENCSSLKKINLPDTVARIEDYGFKGCTILDELNWGKSIVDIGKYAFEGCSAFDEIIIPDTVTSLQNGSFQNCDGLKKVVIPNSVSSIGTSSFYDCDALKEVQFGTGVNSIPDSLFENCDQLESIVLFYGVKSIGKKVFKDCVEFNSITIPRSVTSIDISTFSYPDKLTIYGATGTYAEEYANTNSIKFVAIDKPATEISFSQNEITLSKWNKAKLVLNITPSDFTDEVNWKSSDTNIVTIDETGTIRAENVGTATVKVIVGSLSISCKITVVEPISRISLNSTSKTMNALDTYQLQATISPESAYVKGIKWESSAPEIASVDENGLVTAHKKGSSVITVTAYDYDGSKTRNCSITVSNNATVAKNVSEMESPHSYVNNCSDFWVYTLDGAQYIDVTFDERTEIEDGFDYLYVFDKNGNQIGKYTGTALAGQTVTITGDTVKIQVVSDDSGNTWGFKLTDVKEADGPPPDLEADQKAADAVISQIQNMDVSNPASVEAAREAYDALTPAQKSLIDDSILKKLSDAEEAIEEAKEKEKQDQAAAQAATDIIYQVDMNDPASVEAARQAYDALTPDQKNLIDTTVLKILTDAEQAVAEAEEKERQDQAAAQAAVNVINQLDVNDPVSVEAARQAYDFLTPDQKKLVDSSIVKILTDAEKVVEEEKQKEDQAAAAVATEIINKMDPTDSASVEAAKKAYEALTEDQKKLVDPAIVEQLEKAVKENSKVLVASIKLTGISNKIATGKKVQLQATVLPVNATNTVLKWTSSNIKVATVTQNGLVVIKKKTGGKSVKITATATDGSGKQAVFTIKVMKGAVTKITIKGAKKTLKVGKTMKLRAVVKKSKGTANKKIKWTSSNSEYATVSTSGKVKALKAGKGKKVKITAMATDGSGKKKTVTIKIK